MGRGWGGRRLSMQSRACLPHVCYTGDTMKTISVAISPEDYEVFRQVARARQCSIAQLIREAMAFYRTEQLQKATPLTELPTLPGHRPRGALPSRAEIYTEIFTDTEESRL